MKKIVAITNSWPPSAFGHGLYFYNLLKNYSNLTILGPVHDGAYDRRYVPLLKCGNIKRIAPRIKSALVQAEILIKPLFFFGSTKQKPELSIASQTLYSGLTCFLIKLFFNVPYIVVGHGEEFSIFYHAKNKLKYRVSKQVINSACLVICNSKSTSTILNRFYGVDAKKCKIIYPPVDLSRCLVDDEIIKQVQAKFNLKEKFVLMAGRLNERRKGFDIGIEAFAMVLNEIPDVRLVIAGPGECDYLHQKIYRLGIGGKVKIVGRLQREELMACFASCEIFVMPNRTLENGDLEGFGIVFLEANSFAKPVIGGNSGGAVEAIEDGVSGFVVNTDNIQEVKDAIVKLLSDSSMRERMGKDGDERVRRLFSADITCREFSKTVADIK